MAQTEKEVVYGKRAMEILVENIVHAASLPIVDNYHALLNEDLNRVLFSYVTCGEDEHPFYRDPSATEEELGQRYELLGAIVDSGEPNRRVVSYTLE